MHHRFEVEVQQSQLIAPDSDLYLILSYPHYRSISLSGEFLLKSVFLIKNLNQLRPQRFTLPTGISSPALHANDPPCPFIIVKDVFRKERVRPRRLKCDGLGFWICPPPFPNCGIRIEGCAHIRNHHSQFPTMFAL